MSVLPTPKISHLVPPCFQKINNIIDYITVHQKKLRRNNYADLSQWLLERRRLRVWIEKTGIENGENEDYLMHELPQRCIDHITNTLKTDLPNILDKALVSITETVEHWESLIERARDKWRKTVFTINYIRWSSSDPIREFVRTPIKLLYDATSGGLMERRTALEDWKEEYWEEWEGIQECAFEKEDAFSRFCEPQPRGEVGRSGTAVLAEGERAKEAAE